MNPLNGFAQYIMLLIPNNCNYLLLYSILFSLLFTALYCLFIFLTVSVGGSHLGFDFLLHVEESIYFLFLFLLNVFWFFLIELSGI